MTILVTGGCGFIGTNFIHRYMDLFPDERVVNVDKLTYAGNPLNHIKLRENPNYSLYAADIGDYITIQNILMAYRPNLIINFAAESHVDNSINDATPFLNTNVLGTYNLLECCRKNIDWIYRFLHVSTDEVYGSLGENDAAFNEKTAYDPRSPYSASKAASDHIVSAYYHTHGIPTIISNCSNNYGPYQHAEKFIPVVIKSAMADKPIPVYGNGMNIRDWIYVTDHCDALIKVLYRGRLGEKYNIGGKTEVDNLTLTKMILNIMGKPESLISFVEDRKGHDFRYAIDNGKIQSELGWSPKVNLHKGLKDTIEWYTR